MKIGFKALIAVAALALFVSRAEAINVTLADVQNGLAFVEGNRATRDADITWESLGVGKTNNGGSFSFSSVVPADCVGALTIGGTTIDVALTSCTPGGTSAAPAPVPQTGVTISHDANDPPQDDGTLQKGVVWPNPRFKINVNLADDNGAGGGIAGNGICDGTEICNGTISDHLTGLIWLRNANCPEGATTWQQALDFVAGINTGDNYCGDTSDAGLNQTDWRLPNVRELHSLVDYSRFNPSLPLGHPFSNFQASLYWSSTNIAIGSNDAWVVFFLWGFAEFNLEHIDSFVIAVRGGS